MKAPPQPQPHSRATHAFSFAPAARLLQRKCACGGTPGLTGECDECRKKRLQRAPENPAPANQNDSPVPPIVHEVLRAPGQPLEPATRAMMEPRFGHDFSQVRIHTGSKAGESARSIGALAYTFGSDVVFASGQYEPHTLPGQMLLAHELTHTIQQRNDKQTEPALLSSADDPQEHEAAAVSMDVLTDARRDKTTPSLTPESNTIQAGWPLILAVGVGGGIVGGAIYATWAYNCLKPLEMPMYVATFGDAARTGGFRLNYYNQTHTPVPSNVWDAFGHCWIACASTQRCGRVTAAIAGKSREFYREYIGGGDHDSYQQDTANQTTGRGFGAGGGDCARSCQDAALHGTLDLSAPRATFWDPVSGDY